MDTSLLVRRPAAQYGPPVTHPNCRRAVMVPGHAPYKGGGKPENETRWHLLDYQKENGHVESILAHIQAGVDAATRDPHALLVFTGGRSRSGCLQGEASGYALAGAEKGWLDPLNGRVGTEDHARDSLDNVLYAVASFVGATGRLPEKITCYGFEFKRKRFEYMARTLGLGPDQFCYYGIDSHLTQGYAGIDLGQVGVGGY